MKDYLVAMLGAIGCETCSSGISYAADLDARATADGQPYWVEQLADDLKFPSAIVWLLNGDALIPERQGGLRVLHQGGKLDPIPVSGLPPSFQNIYNGYKDIAVDPDYQSNRTIYLLISEGTYDGHYASVYRARYEGHVLSELTRIFRSKDEVAGVGHIAARMMFLPDKTLLVAVAENHYYKPMAQRLDSHIGKLLRINRDGTIPPDNPFREIAGALPEIWSYGHRVTTGLYRDPEKGTLYELEPGPKGGDELNVLKAGGNFGWATATWGFEYNGELSGPLQSGPGIEDPILVWMPAVSPSGLTQYRGTAFPNWTGDFFVGHLSGRALQRLRLDGRQVVLQERMLMDLGERIREVKMGPDGRLYLLTDHQNGRVLRLQPGVPQVRQRDRVAHKLNGSWGLEALIPKPGDPVKGKEAFLERCAGCHGAGDVPGGEIGPNLAGVFGHKAGSRPGYSYSAAMAASPQMWNAMALELFISDPIRYLPGTNMSAPPLSDHQVVRDLVAFIEHQSASQ